MSPRSLRLGTFGSQVKSSKDFGRGTTRAGHGHDPDDGHIAAIRGQYEVWQYLHQQFPDLVLEECGYGNRLDYGLARYMRTNWLDDSSSDARPVRRRLINGSYIYPAPYLETWIYKSDEIDTEKHPDLLATACFTVSRALSVSR